MYVCTLLVICKVLNGIIRSFSQRLISPICQNVVSFIEVGLMIRHFAIIKRFICNGSRWVIAKNGRIINVWNSMCAPLAFVLTSLFQFGESAMHIYFTCHHKIFHEMTLFINEGLQSSLPLLLLQYFIVNNSQMVNAAAMAKPWPE